MSTDTPRAEGGTTYAIDYDGTWTTDPAAWGHIAGFLRDRGHRVLLVTARATGHVEVEALTGPHVDRVIFTPGMTKRDAMACEGEAVDVWIDDKPEMVDRVR